MGKLERTNIIKAQPVISTSIYAALDCVGTVLTLSNAMAMDGGAGVLHSLVVIDDDNEKAELDILLFDDLPTGTMTDNGAWTPASGDPAKLLGRVNILATDYLTVVTGSLAIATFRNIGLPVRSVAGSPHVYALVLAAGTPTYAATTDLRFVFGFLLD